jgi:hypothetical protein
LALKNLNYGCYSTPHRSLRLSLNILLLNAILEIDCQIGAKVQKMNILNVRKQKNDFKIDITHLKSDLLRSVHNVINSRLKLSLNKMLSQ